MKKYEKVALGFLIVIGILTIVAGIYVGLHKKNKDKVFNQKDFEKIIEDDLGILLEKNSLADITNEDITAWAFNKSKYNYSTNSFESKYLEDIITDSVFRNNEYELTDIYQVRGNYADIHLSDSLKCFTLKGTRYINDETCGSSGLGATPYVTKFVYFKQEKNRYIISAKSIFTTILSGPDDIRLYSSYEKARKASLDNSFNNLSFKTFTMKENGDDLIVPYDDVDKYINENWNTIKDKLDTYTYIFEVENNEIVLKDFIHTSADIEEEKDKENFINNNIVINNSKLVDSFTTEEKQIISEANYYLNESYMKPIFKYLDKSVSINELANNDKLWMLYELVGEEGFVKYDDKDLTKLLKEKFGKDFNIIYTDFYCNDSSWPCYTYDSNSLKFINNHNPISTTFTNIANMKLIDFTAKDNRFDLTYNLLLIKENNSTPNNFFTNIDGEEVLANTDSKYFTNATAFNEIEDKLKPITFSFLKEDKNLVLTDIKR